MVVGYYELFMTESFMDNLCIFDFKLLNINIKFFSLEKKIKT
jgi:hypothetical protein